MVVGATFEPGHTTSHNKKTFTQGGRGTHDALASVDLSPTSKDSRGQLACVRHPTPPSLALCPRRHAALLRAGCVARPHLFTTKFVRWIACARPPLPPVPTPHERENVHAARSCDRRPPAPRRQAPRTALVNSTLVARQTVSRWVAVVSLYC